MATRQYYSTSSTGLSTTTSTSDQIKATLTFAPDANSDYAIIVGGLFYGLTGGATRIKLKEDGTQKCYHFVRAAQNYEYAPFMFLHFLSTGGSPSSVSFTLTYASEINSYTSGTRDVYIIAIKLTAADYFDYTAGPTALTGQYPTITTAITRTFTPATTGNYLIVGYAEHTTPVTGTGSYLSLKVDGTIARNSGSYTSGNTITGTAGIVFSTSLSNSSHTIILGGAKVQFNFTNYMQNTRLLILRWDEFEDVKHGYLGGSTTSTSYVTAGSTLTFDIENVPYLFLVGGYYEASNQANYEFGYIDRDGSNIQGTNHTAKINNNYKATSAFARLITPSAASTSVVAKVKSNSASYTAYNYSDFAAIQLEAVGGIPMSASLGIPISHILCISSTQQNALEFSSHYNQELSSVLEHVLKVDYENVAKLEHLIETGIVNETKLEYLANITSQNAIYIEFLRYINQSSSQPLEHSIYFDKNFNTFIEHLRGVQGNSKSLVGHLLSVVSEINNSVSFILDESISKSARAEHLLLLNLLSKASLEHLILLSNSFNLPLSFLTGVLEAASKIIYFEYLAGIVGQKQTWNEWINTLSAEKKIVLDKIIGISPAVKAQVVEHLLAVTTLDNTPIEILVDAQAFFVANKNMPLEHTLSLSTLENIPIEWGLWDALDEVLLIWILASRGASWVPQARSTQWTLP